MSASTRAVGRGGMDLLGFGMILFLASELVFFGSLFGAYFMLRTLNTPWPPLGVHPEILLPAIATGVLLASSWTMHASHAAVESDERPSAIRWALATAALGIVFLVLKVVSWTQEDFTITSHPYGSIFFGLSGLHAAHLLVGIGIVLLLAARLPAPRPYNVVPFARATSYYWHFVDGVWIALFLTLYVIT